MKILHLNTHDISGGAARAAYRIHKGLQGIGIDSKMLVQTKLSDDKTVIGPGNKVNQGLALLRPTLDSTFKTLFSSGSKTIFSPAWLPFSGIPSQIKSISPHIVHLHWICSGMLRIEDLKRINKPIIWTLHDMWAFTGGCHYSDGCVQFQQSCGNCPQLGSESEKDLSRWTWRRKQKWWQNLNLTIITPSRWLKSCVLKSTLLKDYPVEVIPNGIDLNRYRPLDRNMARDYLGLPEGKRLILFGAFKPSKDLRKGFLFLQSALKRLSQRSDFKQTELIILGTSEPPNKPKFGFKTTYLGKLYDDISIALVYAACDVFVVPSVEDNLPNTIIEALACGISCVAFNVGGISEMIEHKVSGYLAKPLDIEELARGIAWVLENKQRLHSLSANARKKAETDFDIKIVAEKYAALYQRVYDSCAS